MQTAQVADRVLVKIVLTAAVAVAGVWFSLVEPPHVPTYFMVDDLAASGFQAHEGEHVRVHGFVAPGSIREHLTDASIHDFLLTKDGVSIRVVVHGPLPDTFKDYSETVVEGLLVQRYGRWALEGDEIISKCGGKYEGANDPMGPVPRFR